MTESRDPRIYFDEAGNSGQNLLDHEQPVFSLASVLLNESETKTLASAFAGLQSKEIHFSRLRKRPAGQEKILAFFNHEALTPSKVKVSVFHKRFTITAWIVEYLIEPLAARNGLDLHKRNASLSLANVLHVIIPTLFGEESYLELQSKFLRMVRTKDRAVVRDFYEATSALLKRCSSPPARRLLDWIIATQAVVWETLPHLGVTAVDPAIPSFFVHCSEWTRYLARPFRILHDESKPLKADLEMLRSFMSTDSPPAPYGYGTRSAYLPLTVQEIRIEASVLNLQLQLADILASGAAYYFRSKLSTARDEFAEAIDSSGLLRFVFHAVWPTPNISPQEFAAEPSQGENLLEHLSTVLAAG